MDQSPRCAVSRGKRLAVVLLTRTLLGILRRSDLAAASFVAAQHVDVEHAEKVVGLVGFEPTASASRTQRSTKLSHSP